MHVPELHQCVKETNLSGSLPSVAHTATINLQASSCHESRIIASQESNHAGNVVGHTQAWEVGVFLDFCEVLGAPTFLVSRGGNDAGMDSVDADVELAKFLSSG